MDTAPYQLVDVDNALPNLTVPFFTPATLVLSPFVILNCHSSCYKNAERKLLGACRVRFGGWTWKSKLHVTSSKHKL